MSEHSPVRRTPSEAQEQTSPGSDSPSSSSSSRNARQQLEESGPFGRNRSIRSTASRTPRARTGTTPVRQKENSAVAEFGRLFAREQAEEEKRTGAPKPLSADEIAAAERPLQPEAVPTECLLYGYAGKQSEWKVLSKFEKIVSPSIICEDYPREDPNLFLSSSSPLGFSRASVVVHQNLSREAIKKSRIYHGGNHWIKITFDSYQAAERACFYSPVDIDGYMVHCEMWQARGPAVDAPLPNGPLGRPDKADLLQPHLSPRKLDAGRSPRTLSASQGARLVSGKESALAGFERVLQTLPRSHTMPDVQYRQPEDDRSQDSTTASSATATGNDAPPQQLTQHLAPTTPQGQSLRSRSVPQLPSQDRSLTHHDSEYMTHITSVKKAKLRPISEALPPQPTFVERVLRSLPVVSYFVAATPAPSGGMPGAVAGKTDVIGEGPLVRDDGSWDPGNGWYWTFWHGVDGWFGTDFCGLKDD